MYILIFVALTSLILYTLGRRRGWSTAALAGAVGRMLECLGLAVVLMVLNVATAALVILVARVVAGHFFSLYLATDLTLVPLSVAQAVLVQWWRTLATDATRPAP